MTQRRYSYLVGLAVLLLFGSLLVRGRILFAADQLARNYPWRAYPPLSQMGPFTDSWGVSDSILGSFPALAYIHQSFQAGSFPLWNPLEGLGLPAAGSAGLGYMFPVHWLTFGLLPPMVAWHLELAAILLISALSCYAVFRRATGSDEAAALSATAWTFAGWSAAYLQLPSYAWTLALFPLILLGIERTREGKRLAPLQVGVCVALSLTVGHLQVLAPAIAVAVIWTLWRARPQALAIALSMLCGLMMAAYHLVPMVELLIKSERPRIPIGMILSALMLPREFLGMVFPTLMGQPSDNFYFGTLLAHPVINGREHCVYAGMIPLWLACLAVWRRARPSSRPIGAAVLTGLLFAGAPPLYQALCTVLPPLLFLTPTRFLPLVLFGTCLLCGQGWASLKERPLQTREAAGLVGLLSAFLLGALCFIVPASTLSQDFQEWLLRMATHNYAAKPPYFEGDFGPVFVSRVTQHFSLASPAIAVAMLVLAGSVVLLLAHRGKRMPFAPVLGLLCLEVATFFSVMNTTVPAAAYFPHNPDVDFLARGSRLEQVQPPTRVMGLGTGPYPNLLLIEGIDNLEAYETAHPGDYRAVIDALNHGFQLNHQDGLYVGDDKLGDATLDVLGIGKLMNAPRTWDQRYGPPTYQGAGLAIQDRPSALRAYTVDKYRVLDRAQAMKAIMAAGFQPRAEVLLDAPPSYQSPAGPAHFQAVETRLYSAQEVDLEVASQVPTMLVLTDLEFPGWSATVNGKPAPIRKAYGFARAVELAAGASKVSFTFRPTGFPYTPWLAVLSFLALLTGCGLRRPTPVAP
jgi:hypothetical protein